jgi:serine phosphatase RsbU (regulator of sigma subunit)/ketosteroid isomerase-like protein
MRAKEIRAVLASWQDCYARLDASALAKHYAENCVIEGPVIGRHTGRVAVERTAQTLFSAFPDDRLHIEEIVVSANRAFVTAVVEGFGGPAGLPPAAKPFSSAIIFLLTFGNDCKIVHERRMYDSGIVLAHLVGEESAERPLWYHALYREFLERARHEHELKTAAEIQRALLPPTHVQAASFEVAAKSVPCRAIGGDFFDYFNLSDGTFAFVIGDVAGKGPPAALLAALLQGLFTSTARRGGAPATALYEANDALVRRAITSRFATVVYAVLASDGRLRYCNAGHNPPVVVGKSGVRRLQTGGLIIGAFEEATFDEETIQLQSGDVFVAFSDGMTEARNTDDDEFGEERFLSCVTAHGELEPAALLECLFNAVQEFAAGAAQSDDLTALIVRYSGASPDAA